MNHFFWGYYSGMIAVEVDHSDFDSESTAIKLYRILGNKKVRLKRICQWNNGCYQSYPRLRFYHTTIVKYLDKRKWVKTEKDSHLIPYMCMLKKEVENDNI